MSYPILYDKFEKDFFSLGLGPLTNTLKATVSEERNGCFIFESDILTDNEQFKLVEEGTFIKCDAGHTLKDQLFIVKRITASEKGKASIYAEHVRYLAEGFTFPPIVSVSGSGNLAINKWNNSIIGKTPFVVDSDITTDGKTSWTISDIKNAGEALGGHAGSLLDVWGGEYRFDNYHISLLEKRGKPANTLLAYGKNITDFEQDRNIANTYTSVYPYAIYRDNDNDEFVTTNDYIVDSKYTSNFRHKRVLPIDFSDEFDEDKKPNSKELKKLAEEYIKRNDIGIPSVSIKLSFVDLSKTLDYEELAPLEQLSLCDEVRVIYSKLGVNTVAKVIRTVWNVLTDKYDEIEIGEKRTTLSGVIQDHQNQINEIDKQSNNALVSADGKNMIFYGLYGVDGLGEPTATKVGDMWFKPNGEEIEQYIWNGTIWELISYDYSGIQEELEQQKEEINEALDKADKAIEEAGFSKDTSEQAKQDAANALAEANMQGGKLSELSVDLDKEKNKLTVVQKDVSDGKVSINKLEKDSESFRQSISGLENMEIGGNNQVPNSDFKELDKNNQAVGYRLKNGLTSEKVADVFIFSDDSTLQPQGKSVKLAFDMTKAITTPTESYLIYDNIPIIQGENYIFSSYVKATKGTVVTIQIGSAAEGYLRKSYTMESSDWTRITVAKKLTKDKITNIYVGFPYASMNKELSTVEIGGLQLEKGTKETQWKPNPDDAGLKISTIEQNMNGIQTTVENKADKSQVTQLAGQLTSVVKESGYPNLVTNSSLINKDYSGWTGVTSVAKGFYMAAGTYEGNYEFGVNSTVSTAPKQFLTNEMVRCEKNSVYSFSYTSTTNRVGENAAAGGGIGFYDKDGNSIVLYPAYSDLSKGWKEFKRENVKAPEGAVYVRAYFSFTGDVNIYFTKPMLVNSNKAVPYKENTVSQSQITQTKELINLRVEKDKMISQINLSPEKILIQGKKIMLDGDVTMNTAFINNLTVNSAFIKSIKAIDIDAARITTGFMNANRIKAGMLTGNNAEFNLETGTITTFGSYYKNTLRNGAFQIDDVKRNRKMGYFGGIIGLDGKPSRLVIGADYNYDIGLGFSNSTDEGYLAVITVNNSKKSLDLTKIRPNNTGAKETSLDVVAGQMGDYTATYIRGHEQKNGICITNGGKVFYNYAGSWYQLKPANTFSRSDVNSKYSVNSIVEEHNASNEIREYPVDLAGTDNVEEPTVFDEIDELKATVWLLQNKLENLTGGS